MLIRSAPFESSVSDEPATQPRSPEKTPSQDERAVCLELIRAGMIDYVDVPGGVAIIVTPRSGVDLADLRARTRALELMMPPREAIAQASPPPPEERCELFDMARLGVTVMAADGPGAAWLVVTSDEAWNEARVRAMARDFVAKTREGRVE